MPEVVCTARGVWRSFNRSAGDSGQAGEAGEPGGGGAGVAGVRDVRHEAHDARGAGGDARRAHRAAEALLHASRQRRQRRGVPDLRRPRHHAYGDGAGGGAVPTERQVRRDPGWIRGGHGGSGSAAGDAGHAQRQAVSRVLRRRPKVTLDLLRVGYSVATSTAWLAACFPTTSRWTVKK